MQVLKRLLPILLAFSGLCRAQMYEGQQLVHAELIADADGIVPGMPVTLGLHLQAEPGWHTYWQYPGDAGVPTRIDWTLPAGFKAGPIQWPAPMIDKEPGDIVSYVYPGDVLLPVKIETPPDLKPGQTIELRAHASWLVCKEICVPGKADLTLTLPVVASSHSANDGLFQEARGRLPRAGSPPFGASWSREGQTLVLGLQKLSPSTFIEFFPIPGDVQIGHPTVAAQSVRIPLLDPKATADSIDGVVVLHKWVEHSSIRMPPLPDEIWQLSNPPVASPAPLPTSSFIIPIFPTLPLLHWLVFGFLGGLILNVMPCVLPVIALKIFGFIRQAGESPRRILALGFTFVAGIFAWFLFLAGLIVGFKAAGHQLNWAFQFQHPAFVAVMVVILLLFSLNLLGVFEIVLPGRVQAGIQDAAGEEGYAGTFWHGVFATLMATPCTAPFLGPALGFALAQPAGIVFAMFGSIAAGMSAPYAVLAVKPAWLRYLPKPGIWMVRVKQALGVLLMGTVLWLGWVLYKQVASRPEPFPPQLAHALAQDKIVFVDFTADWCVNCKVNERLVLDSAPVEEAFRQKGVILLKADWTSGDADITALLRKFGRAGVPCYVVYPPHGQPMVLPEVITQEIVVHALDVADQPAH
jgi:DsbC/DsbD-like thiol-disulfide interchange protein/cytochrome c biogenesis protein CcdA